MGRDIPNATVARLPVYLRALSDLQATSATANPTVSSEGLARLAGVNAAKVRKDLSYLGTYGTRGVGYDVELLAFQMNRELGLTGDRGVIIAGAGNLGQALANYGGFSDRGFRIVAMVDTDADKIGSELSGVPVHAPGDVRKLVADHPGCIVVVAVPPHVAQDVVDNVVDAGARSILNFAPGVVTVPDGVSMRQVDLGLELQVLSFYAERDAVTTSAGDL